MSCLKWVFYVISTLNYNAIIDIFKIVSSVFGKVISLKEGFAV